MPDARNTILLVDDEYSVRSLLVELLTASGYRVLAAANPAEALRIAERESGAIDLLITDVVLPGISGVELAARFTADRPGAAVLFITGYSGELGGCLAAGSDLLEKPFTALKLRDRVRDLLAATTPVGV